MFGSAALEVTIGLALIYLLLSIFCTAIQEILAAVLRQRAQALSKGIDGLLLEDVEKLPKGVKTLHAEFCAHPLVKPLRSPRKDDLSYISPTVFAQALNDILATPYLLLRRALLNLSSYQELYALCDAKLRELETASGRSSKEIAKEIEKVLDDYLARTGAASGNGSVPASPSFEDLRKTLGTLKARKQIYQVLSILQANSGGEGVLSVGGGLNAGVEQWFNAAMDRVTGWYKRRTQWQVFVIAMVLVGVLNADTFRIVSFLQRNDALRALLAANAAAVSARDLPAATPPAASQRGGMNPETPRSTADLSQVSPLLSETVQLPLPLGWVPPSESALAAEIKAKAEADQKASAAQQADEELAKATAAVEAADYELTAARNRMSMALNKVGDNRKEIADGRRLLAAAYAEKATRDRERAEKKKLADDFGEARRTAERARIRLEALRDLETDPDRFPGTDLLKWGKKIGGLLLTVIACFLGAPFWFDLLRRFVNLRGAGPNPSETSFTPAAAPMVGLPGPGSVMPEPGAAVGSELAGTTVAAPLVFRPAGRP